MNPAPEAARPRVAIFGQLRTIHVLVGPTWRLAILATLVVIAVGYFLVTVLTQQIVDANLRIAEAEARDTVVRRVLLALSPEDMDAPLQGERLAEFDQFVQTSVISARTARIKIWDPDGRVIYANDPSIIGQQFPLGHDLQEALNGATSSERKTEAAAENQSEANLGTLLEVYTPLLFPGQTEPSGVFEIYQVYEPVATDVALMRRYVLLTLAGGLGALYVVLLVMATGVGRFQRQGARLAVSEEKFKDLVQSAEAIVWEADPSTFQSTFVSEEAERLLGYPAENWVTTAGFWVDHIHPEDRERALADYAMARASMRDHSLEYRMVAADGRAVWVRDLIRVETKDGAPARLRGIMFDITERKRADEALRESEARFRAVVDAVPAAILIFDGELAVFTNEASIRMSGYSREKILAPGWLRTYVHPDNLAEVAAHIVPRVHGESFDGRHETRVVRKDGAVRWLEAHAVSIAIDGRPAVLTTAIDVTERRDADDEHRKLNLQIQHAQKLESLGVLAGGIAHDFNNLLAVILGNASLALMELPQGSPARETVEAIEVAAQRASDLTGQMLAYSGKGQFLIEDVSLSRLVEEMSGLLAVAMSKQAVLTYHFAPATPLIEADATQIRQVVMNLITNASDAIGDGGGIIDISTGVLFASREYLSDTVPVNDLPEGEYAFVQVSDTGPGMDAETRARIFDPFFTTKFTGRGLGLASVLGIVRGHRGAIKITSEVDAGTTFTVLLPASEIRAVAAPAQTKGADKQSLPNSTVLLVDDDAAVLSVTRRILERLGCSVISARDGNEAISVFKRQIPYPDVVLLDLTMPGMDGRTAARELFRIDPMARIILMSGYSESDAGGHAPGEQQFHGFIQKPFLPDDLLTALRRALT